MSMPGIISRSVGINSSRLTQGEIRRYPGSMAAKGADLALVGDPLGDCDEGVCKYDGQTYCLDGDICNNIVNHLGMRESN
jgi:hypothetical protein